MFDITPDEIALLNDTDLRELVGRLCEAELVSRGLSPAAVTWGGAQTAADGGLDVRVALPTSTFIDGFVPRAQTGFQIKTPDFARAAILGEMRPAGAIRPVIQELADIGGAYIIISSRGSTADSALRNRRAALRDALHGISNADQLYTDFYDRTRMVTWVRLHPGIVIWVKARAARALVGWHPYGAWSGAAEGSDAQYLLDDKLRLHLSKLGSSRPAQPVRDAIDLLRDELAEAGKMVRLVGLSGVGKTRLVQALFDSRVGSRPLPPSLAVYTNLSDNPDPQPIGLASDLIASRTRAVLIVDNCPSDLHRRLSDLCRGQSSTVSVLTVEYDVRDDQPEATQVVTLDTSSLELVETLIGRRYPHLSGINVRTIAEASGGNTRIAIALAETIEQSETGIRLSDEELFQRLFRQRHDSDKALLLAAKACSLVYSFQGEALAGEEAELPHLALLAGQTPMEIYRHAGELFRRNLVQQRGVWRAVLPHAIANRLAAHALEDIPYDLIDKQLVAGGTGRLARSFSRRLSFLHQHPRAIAIVQKWLAPGGLLGNVTGFNFDREMFENAAPVLPEAALAALERAGDGDQDLAVRVWQQERSLLRSIAYDAGLFERSASLLARAAMFSAEEREVKEVSDTFVSLFKIYLSGTHATIDQRLGLIEGLLGSNEARSHSLGIAALGAVIEAQHFSSFYRFEFGARSRDYGYAPESDADLNRWYGAAFELIERLALDQGIHRSELESLMTRNFRALWGLTQMHDKMDGLFRRFAINGFWREGWLACRQTMHFEKRHLTAESASQLSDLENYLRPRNLQERVRAVVLGNGSDDLDIDDTDLNLNITDQVERLEAVARELGTIVSADEPMLANLLPDLLRGGNRAWSFGRGLAGAALNREATWTRLVQSLEKLPPEQRNVQVLRGFLAELWEQEPDLAHSLLDVALTDQNLMVFLPVLHSAAQLDQRGANRLKRALSMAKLPVDMYRNLAIGRVTNNLPGSDFKDLLLAIAEQPTGVDVAFELLYMRLFADRIDHRDHEPELLEVGRELLQRLQFRRRNQHLDHRLAGIIKACVVGQEATAITVMIAGQLRQAVAAHDTTSFHNHEVLSAILDVQPLAVLDALFAGDERDQQVGVGVFSCLGDHRANPADAIPCEALVTWCRGDAERRFPLAAAIISLSHHSKENGSQVWSEQAKALLAATPDPRGVLAVFITRFRPLRWSGSRAAILERNAGLLDSLVSDSAGELSSLVAEAKDQLEQEVIRERKWETERDRVRDERFE